jgi:glyoxylase-like metal-dependent hydrolase (beta-lactamase superfamily II)
MTIDFEQIRKDSKIEKIQNGITRIVSWYDNCCSYWIEGSSRNVLIDASYPLTIDDRIDILVLTHPHCDHITFAKELVEIHGCEVYASRGTVKWLEDYGNEIIPDYRTDVKEILTKYKNPPVVYPVEITKIIKEGDVINMGSSTLRILETPGHSIGDTCILDEERKILFTGDMLFEDGRNGGWKIGSHILRGSNKELLAESVKRLKSLKVQMICPGHIHYSV